MDKKEIAQYLLTVFNRLRAHYGPQHWWPAEEPFEVIVGAILTQSAAWSNVEKAITNLKTADALSPEALRRLTQEEIAGLIRPCGYYNSKARKLKSFAGWFGSTYQDDLNRLFDDHIQSIRQKLLSIYGIGDETADSIILYAGSKPIFVVDAYTRRITGRLGLAPRNKDYTGYQQLFMVNLPDDQKLFNEYHALLVALGKKICRPHPRCQDCCLNDMCQFYIPGAGLQEDPDSDKLHLEHARPIN